jgi:hypothetical protein
VEEGEPRSVVQARFGDMFADVVIVANSTPLFTVGAGGSGCISDSSPSSIAPSAPASTISGVGGGGGRPGSGSGSAGNNR